MVRVLCCASGGVDSMVAIQKLKDEGYEPIPVYVNYGQKTRDVEVAHLHRWYGEELRVLDFDLSDCIKGWATDVKDSFVPVSGTDKNLLFIPGRNIFILLRLCVMGYYEGIHHLAIGNHKSDTVAGDCKPPFLESFAESLTLGMSTYKTEFGVSILRPIENMTKADVIRYGHDRGMELEHTWSCYDSPNFQEPYVHCGKCWNCIDRKEAFRLAGVEDKTRYSLAL